MELLKSLLTLWVWKETRQAWTTFSKLKALVGLEKLLSYRFQYNAKDDNSEFSLPNMVPYVKVKFQVIVFGYRAKIDNSELRIVTSKQAVPCVIEKFQL